MSFSNYGNTCLPVSFFYDGTLFGFPYYGYVLPDASQFQAQDGGEIVGEQLKSSNSSKEFDKQKLIQNLKNYHFQSIHHKKTHWTFQEDKLLERLVEIQKLEWRQIPKFFGERTQNMCYSRYRRISMSARDRNWSKQEEQAVIDLIKRFGQKWKLISSKMPKFTPKQIRERYLNYLRPNINKNDFSFEEDFKICQYVLSHGKHWRKMEEILAGRSEGAIKGRYYGKLQRIIDNSYKETIN